MTKAEAMETGGESFPVMAQEQERGAMMTRDSMAGIIELAEKSEVLGAALDKVRRFILARALPGDWVKFNDNQGGGYLEMVGAGAERVAATLGVSFTNWRDRKESGTDKHGEFFVWEYECDVHFAGRVIEKCQGRSSSRDRFFGYAHGAWKELCDVKESDIRTAARRAAIKNGVKEMLGLRRIPVGEAENLGLQLYKVKEVNFGGGSAKATESKPTTTAPAKADGGIEGVMLGSKVKKSGKGAKGTWTLMEVALDNGTTATTFDKKLSDKADALKGKKVALYTSQGKFGLNLENIIELATASKPPVTNDEPPAEDELPMDEVGS